MDCILDSLENVKGQIYLITNTVTGKKYVGQTMTHRKNKEKYRPYGYEQRFKTHMSDALCNTKKHQCRYLNNSIRKDGKEAFTITLITQCDLDEADALEQHYIKEYGTLYPNGYNLTKGGKGVRWVKVSDDVDPLNTNSPKKRGGCKFRSQETREKMKKSHALTLSKSTNTQQKLMLKTQKQHANQKYERFKGVIIDKTNLEQYIHYRNPKSGPFIKVKIGELQAAFVGKYETIDELRQKALSFLESLE